jgi:hypothetical protein
MYRPTAVMKGAMMMAGQEAVEAGSGQRKRVRAPTQAGYRQVIELMGQGYSAQEIRRMLRMPPNRMRQILASRSFQAVMQLDGQVARSAAVMRVGSSAHEAAGVLKAAGQHGDPECARKAAVKVLDIAMQPPRLPEHRPSAENREIARLLLQLAGDAGETPVPPPRVVRNARGFSREDGNA